MADQVLTKQKLTNADEDLGDLEEVLNGPPGKLIKTRLGREVYTLASVPQINTMTREEVTAAVTPKANKVDVDTALSNLSTTANKYYSTLAAANADIANITLNQSVTIGEEANSGLWEKKTAGATSLTKSPYDPLTQAKGYADEKTKNLVESSNEILDEAQDVNLQTYRYTDAFGGLHLVGVDGSVQNNVNDLQERSNKHTQSESLIYFEDKVGNIIAKFDDQSNLNLPADLHISGKSILQNINEKMLQVNYQNILMQKFDKIKKLVPIATKNEDNLTKRMPFAIKTTNGLLYFHHKQIQGFDGDGTGSELWKAIISIDSGLNVNIESRELFLAPDEPRGIVKHPTLGRTSDNRIVLIYEKRLETNEPYTRYMCYSSDEGLTFTEPTVINPVGAAPNNSIALGTTGTIVTARNNRMIVPLYAGSACFCMYSDDDGVSWRYSGRVSAIEGYEPSISLDMDNNLVMDIRPLWDGPFHRSRAKSTDNGTTWSILESQELPSASSQGVIFRDENIGAIIQAHATNKGSPRTQYKLFLSYNNAVTFPFSYQPFEDQWYGGYSQILKWEDGIYIIVIEYADNFTSLNSNENAGLLILTLSEILSNVSRN